jgi:redox-sensitive bicupin YhaK (pirin superfamily)
MGSGSLDYYYQSTGAGSSRLLLPRFPSSSNRKLMQLIKASQKRSHGNKVFHIDILFPGTALGLADSGFYTIGRIDHASFRPPGVVPMHPHRDDEILSYMRSGLQIHKDNTGQEVRISDTYMMMMNAGSGIQHEEIAEKEVEMLQIFMRPFNDGLPPQIQFHSFPTSYSRDEWRLVAGDADEAPLKLRVATSIFDTRLSEGSSVGPPGGPGEYVHLLYCFNGNITAGEQTLRKGDSLVFDNEAVLISALAESDLVLFKIKKNAEYSMTGMYSGNQNLL